MRARAARIIAPAALTLAAAGLAACADAPTSLPGAALSARPAGPAAAPRLGTGTPVSYVGDTTVTRFQVNPWTTNTYVIAGAHRLTVPANTFCDPARSSYGPTEWNKPCAPLTTAIVVTAKSYTTPSGHPRVDFQPALRFVRNLKGELPKLYLVDKAAAQSGGFAIVYCTDAGVCVDESLADPALVTQTDLRNGFLYRALQHFSGYTLSVGRSSAY